MWSPRRSMVIPPAPKSKVTASLEPVRFDPDKKIEKIGIMTCGGDCPGLNPVIRAATITAIRLGWKVIGIEDSMQGLINLDYRSPNGNIELTIDKVDDIITRGGTILGSDNHSDPFRFAVVNDKGEKVEIDVSLQVLKNIETLGLDALVVIGGDGSVSIANRLRVLSGNTLKVVGIPKTIDNDLAATDYTFGFNTAIQTISEAIDKIKDTARSHDRTIIIEVMGRDAGWLALHGGMSGAAHVILVPELPYDVGAIAETIHKRNMSGKPFSIIVIAEGAKAAKSAPSYLKERQPGEMIRYGGAGDRLCAELEKYAKHENIKLKEIRVTVLGYIQRGGSPTNYDRILGTRLGEYAISEILYKGLGGHMAALRGTRIETVTFEEACAYQKLIDAKNDQMVRTCKLLGICMGDREHFDNPASIIDVPLEPLPSIPIPIPIPLPFPLPIPKMKPKANPEPKPQEEAAKPAEPQQQTSTTEPKPEEAAKPAEPQQQTSTTDPKPESKPEQLVEPIAARKID